MVLILIFCIGNVEGKGDHNCLDSACYCKNVGKNAYNGIANARGLRGIKLGKIVGVSWKTKGSFVSRSQGTASRDAYYYIIDDGLGKPFPRQCREIDAK